MIKVFDEVTGTGIKIEVIGRPYGYQVRVGKTGTWTVARGRTAGQVKEGEKWGRAMYYYTLKQALEGALEAISTEQGIPVENTVLVGAKNWDKLIALEEERIRLIDKVDKEYQGYLDKYGKDLSGLSKSMAKSQPDEEEEAEEEVVESEEEVS
jgi:hypothetical protein